MMLRHLKPLRPGMCPLEAVTGGRFVDMGFSVCSLLAAL